MTQKDKELLFVDICNRIPYGLVVQESAQYSKEQFADKWQKEPHDYKIIGINGKNSLITNKSKEELTYSKGIVSKPITIPIYNALTKQIARPYLRSLTTMTPAEKSELMIISKR